MSTPTAFLQLRAFMTTARLPWLLLGGHCLICIAFLVARDPEARGLWLDELETVRHEGGLLLNSAAPAMYLAERPLFEWSEWHGGEATWVKALEVANFVPLVATRFVDFFLGIAGILPVRTRSWVVAGWFFALSGGQWLGLGVVLRRILRQAAHRTIETSERQR